MSGRTILFVLVLGALLLPASMWAGEGRGKGVAELKKEVARLEKLVAELQSQLEGTAKPVNLARTSLAQVVASSVNGERAFDDPQFGILNAFDKGENWIDGVHFTSWMSEPEAAPWVEVRFKGHLTITEVQVEGGPAFTTRLFMTKGGEQDYPKQNEKLVFEKPVKGVSRVKLSFVGDDAKQKKTVRVNEIRVLGYAPPQVKYKEAAPSLLATKHSALLTANEAFARWQQSMWGGVGHRMEETKDAFVVTFRRGGLDMLRVTVEKETAKAKARPLARWAPYGKRGATKPGDGPL